LNTRPSPARELFVWYRVREGQRSEALAAVRAMQRSLVAEWPGLQARLLTRAGTNSAATWMETYARAGAGSSTGIDGAVTSAIEAAAQSLATLIDGDRHSEAFESDGSA
jgi:Domain of unknown function (DUF4936)